MTIKRWLRRVGVGCTALMLIGTITACQTTGTHSDTSPGGESSGGDTPNYAFGTWEERSAALHDPNGRLMIVAHRGFWSEENPENSMAALEAAYALGVDMVELDVYTTADNELVLSHDADLKRMTNVVDAFKDGTVVADKWSYQIEDLPLSEIKKLRLKAGEGGDNAPLTDEPMITLREAMEYCRGRMYICIDPKGADMNRVYEEVAACDAWDIIIHNPGGSTLSEYDGKVAAIRALHGGQPVRVWSLQGKTIDEAIAKAKNQLLPQLYEMPAYVSISIPALYWEAVVDGTYDLEVVLNEELKEAVAGKTRLNIFTSVDWGRRMGREYDCEEMWGKLIDAGFSVIMTDRAEELCAYRKQRFGVGY